MRIQNIFKMAMAALSVGAASPSFAAARQVVTVPYPFGAANGRVVECDADGNGATIKHVAGPMKGAVTNWRMATLSGAADLTSRGPDGQVVRKTYITSITGHAPLQAPREYVGDLNDVSTLQDISGTKVGGDAFKLVRGLRQACRAKLGLGN